MTPEEVIKILLEDVDLWFANWDLNRVHDYKDEKGYDERFLEIGEMEKVDHYFLMDDDNLPIQISVVHFKKFGYYIEERQVVNRDEYLGCEYYLVEPVGQKVVYGNPRKLSE